MTPPLPWWLRDPACWRWKAPTDAFIEGLRREWAPPTEQRLCWVVMCEWQHERCAVCGRRWRELRIDHDHETGLVRGLLCPSCNTREGFDRSDGDTIFAKYRERTPAMMCGLIKIYEAPRSY